MRDIRNLTEVLLESATFTLSVDILFALWVPVVIALQASPNARMPTSSNFGILTIYEACNSTTTGNQNDNEVSFESANLALLIDILHTFWVITGSTK
jgi:hypothetical protein